MLLPPSMQDKTQFLPLGRPMQKTEPVKADPVRDFERHNHDIPGQGRHHVSPAMASLALRSLFWGESAGQAALMRDLRPMDERKAAYERTSKLYSDSINREYAEPWEGLKSLLPGDTVTTVCGMSFQVGDMMLSVDGDLALFHGETPLTWPPLSL